MATYSSVITYGGYTLYISKIVPVQVPATKKQVVGKNIARINIPGINEWEWELQISGIIWNDGTVIDTHRDNLLSTQDADTHAYVDGKHDGNYYVIDLDFDDSGENLFHYNYTLRLVEK